MALTRDQKNAIAAVDYVAGLAAIETGFFSFFIGAAASTAYYLDKKATDGWNMDSPVVGPIPSTSNNTGVNHNLACELFLTGGYDTPTYGVMLPIACQVRPDWTSDLEAITEAYFNGCVSSALSQDMSTVAAWMIATTNVIPLNSTDSVTVTNTFNILQTAEQGQWVSSLDTLISKVSGFTLTDPQKQSFINALQILQLSFVLWGS